MAKIIFYEKPGCINNTKQKALLQASGHVVEARNLLTESWSPESLYQFLKDRPQWEWFNRTAPLIREGEIVPEKLDEQTSLALMVKNPILIRRPLIQVGDRYTVGFNLAKIDAWLGLTAANGNIKELDLETCPRSGR
ncbi:Nitrogenase-associated protein [Tumidithrix helvetica PCC 7403]|uniref:ArsC/Spx/MgsR family protein n=1 Tax=Tumidithrix helvetica TaxID=3457545 RepID=UPI003CABA9C4